MSNAIEDIIVSIIDGTATVSRVGFGIPVLAGKTGQRSVLIKGSGVTELVAKSVTRQAAILLEITEDIAFGYVFNVDTVEITVPAGTKVRDLIADFNANAPVAVTDEMTLETSGTGSGAVVLIPVPEELTFLDYYPITSTDGIKYFYDTTDTEYKMIKNIFGSTPTVAKMFVLDVFGSTLTTKLTANDNGDWWAVLTTSLIEADHQETEPDSSGGAKPALPTVPAIQGGVGAAFESHQGKPLR